jgi:glycosyltransferase involved in cell wall biosynthesis
MALGLVPIVVDYGGPGEIVTDNTGFRLPIGSRESIVANLTGLLSELADGRHDLTRLAANGLERVQSLYTWKRKAEQLSEVYEWVCGERAAAPSFPFLVR